MLEILPTFIILVKFLSHWYLEFVVFSQIQALGFNEKFIRTWEYYFDYCAAGFKTCTLGNYQVCLLLLHFLQISTRYVLQNWRFFCILSQFSIRLPDSWNFCHSDFLFLPDCVQSTWKCCGIWWSIQGCTFCLLTVSFIRTLSLLQLFLESVEGSRRVQHCQIICATFLFLNKSILRASDLHSL